MTDLETRAALREQMVRIAKDSIVHRLAQLYLTKYRAKLEHLNLKDKIDPKTEEVPIGKELFTQWVREMISGAADGAHKGFFPEVAGIVDNSTILKQYAIQIADEIAKSNTSVRNPMRDYGPSEDVVFERKAHMKKDAAEEKRAPNLFTAPVEHSRYCPEHPGSMLRRVSDNVYQCPIEGSIYTNAPWMKQYSYAGGHEVKFETGVQNQTSPAWNKMHPLPSFLEQEPKQSEMLKDKGKKYDFEKLYDVFEENRDINLPSAPATDKEAVTLSRLTRRAQEACPQCGKPDCKCMAEGKECKCPPAKEKTAQQLFAPTTVPTRQCPDHPGQQLIRIEDNVRQCGLDGKVYDYTKGFETYDGEKHNGGSVQNQMAIPDGSIIVRLDRQASADSDNTLSKIARPRGRPPAVGPLDSQKVQQFLYQALQHLPADSRERKVLNYKFSNSTSLEQAIAAIEEHERLQMQTPQEAQQSNGQMVQQGMPPNVQQPAQTK